MPKKKKMCKEGNNCGEKEKEKDKKEKEVEEKARRGEVMSHSRPPEDV